MLENLFLSLGSFSVYLNLRECVIIIYLSLLIFLMYLESGTFIAAKEFSNFIIGHFFIFFCHFMNLFFTFKAYFRFKYNIGFNGFRNDTDYYEEEI